MPSLADLAFGKRPATRKPQYPSQNRVRCSRQPRRTVSKAKGAQSFPYPFRHFCGGCDTVAANDAGSGCSMLLCDNCLGNGVVLTEPGGAGVPFKVGQARCKVCHGIGVVPCPICGGREVILPPPDPDNGPQVPHTDDEGLTISEWLAKFGGG